jgi:hypothetical protein
LRTVGLTVSDPSPATTTDPLLRLSGPCQCSPITGVTVYFQVPTGTPTSVQLMVEPEPLTVPEHAGIVACGVSLLAS